MNGLTKGFLAFLIVVSTASLVSAQPSFPHTVHGENFEVSGGPFSDDGEAYQGNVYAVRNGETLASVDVEDGSFEDLLVSGLVDGEEFSLAFNQVVSDRSISFESGKVETVSGVTREVDDLEAVIDSDRSVADEGEEFEFDAASSSGSTGVVSYSWEFGDGDSASGEEVSHSYSEDGEYSVELTVEDEFGNEALDTLDVEVENPSSSGTIDSGDDDESTPSDEDDQEDNQQEQDEGDQGDDSQTDGETGDSQDGQAGEDPVRQVDASTENGSAEAEIERVEPNENIQVNIPDSIESGESSVESVTFSSNTEASDVSVEVSEYGKSFEKVSEKLDNKKPKGKVYSYQDITVSNVEDDSIGKASVNFKVKKSFIEENDGSVGDVRLSRFKDGGWQAFEAESIGETDTYYRMESQVPGFSTFAVTLVDDESGSGLPLIPLVLALVLVIVSIAVYRFRDEIEEFMAGAEEGRESGSEDYSFN